MPLFSSMLRDFEDDPFYTGPREQMRQMEQMMGSFMNPFESLFGDMGMGFPSLMAPEETHNHSRRNPDTEHGLMPFGFGRDLMFPNMRNMFADFERMAGDPNCHSFSSSSVYTYSTGEDGRPKIYQASSSTRTAPGGVKETRKTVTDSEQGLKKMAIGHHINERAHIVERTQYNNNEQEESEELINLGEAEVPGFNQEWQARTRRVAGPAALEQNAYRHRRHNHDSELKSLPAPPRKRDMSDRGEKTHRKGDKHKQPKLKSKHDYA